MFVFLRSAHQRGCSLWSTGGKHLIGRGGDQPEDSLSKNSACSLGRSPAEEGSTEAAPSGRGEDRKGRNAVTTRNAPARIVVTSGEVQEMLLALIRAVPLGEFLDFPRETVDWVLSHPKPFAGMVSLLLRHAPELYESRAIEIACARRFPKEVRERLEDEGWKIFLVHSGFVLEPNGEWDRAVRREARERGLDPVFDEPGPVAAEMACCPANPLVPDSMGLNWRQLTDTQTLWSRDITEKGTTPAYPTTSEAWFLLRAMATMVEGDLGVLGTATLGTMDGYALYVLSSPGTESGGLPRGTTVGLANKDYYEGSLHPNVGILKVLVPA